MSRPLISELEVSPAEVLSRLTGWSKDYRADPCPAAVADTLVGFAFLVGLQAAACRTDAAHSILQQVSHEQPSAYQRSADVARSLFEPAAC